MVRGPWNLTSYARAVIIDYRKRLRIFFSFCLLYADFQGFCICIGSLALFFKKRIKGSENTKDIIIIIPRRGIGKSETATPLTKDASSETGKSLYDKEKHIMISEDVLL